MIIDYFPVSVSNLYEYKYFESQAGTLSALKLLSFVF